MVSEGDSVPKFAVNDANGNKVKSSDFKGKKHAIYFYPKDFTPGCTTEADEFSKDYKKFQKEEIEIIGVSPDDVESHKKFCDKRWDEFPPIQIPNDDPRSRDGNWACPFTRGRQ